MKKLLPVILIGVFAGAMVLVCAGIAGYFAYHSVSKPALVFSEAVSLETNSAAVMLSNHESAPIRIDKVSYNGEYNAVASAQGGIFVADKQPPFTLTIGETKEFVWKVPGGPALSSAYPKEILFVIVYTDRGTFRYDF